MPKSRIQRLDDLRAQMKAAARGEQQAPVDAGRESFNSAEVREARIDREQAWELLMRIVERPKWHGPGAEPGEDELMDEVAEEIRAMRREGRR